MAEGSKGSPCRVPLSLEGPESSLWGGHSGSPGDPQRCHQWGSHSPRGPSAPTKPFCLSCLRKEHFQHFPGLTWSASACCVLCLPCAPGAREPWPILTGVWAPWLLVAQSAAGVVGDKADGGIGIWGGLAAGSWAHRGFLRPLPSLLIPGSPQGSLRCPGSWRAWSSLAALRGLGGESTAQSSPPQSRTVQNKSTQNRAAFLSSDSSAREWKRLEPTEPVTIPRTGATGPAPVAPELHPRPAGLGTREMWWLQGPGVACVCVLIPGHC